MACGLHWSTPCSCLGPSTWPGLWWLHTVGVNSRHPAFPSRLFDMLVKIVPSSLRSLCAEVSEQGPVWAWFTLQRPSVVRSPRGYRGVCAASAPTLCP